MIPLRRGPAPPVATLNDGRNKVVVRYAEYAESPLYDGGVWDGIEIYANCRDLLGYKQVQPLGKLFEDYDGIYEANNKGGVDAVIKLLKKDYGAVAFPLGFGKHGPGTETLYIGGVSPSFGSYDSAFVGLLVFPKDYEYKDLMNEEGANLFCKSMGYYMRGEVYEYELIDGKGEEVGYSGQYYGDDEFVEAVVDQVKNYNKWDDFIVVTEGNPPVSDYIEERILKAFGKKLVVSGNRKLVRNAPRAKKSVKAKSTSSPKKKSVKRTVPTKGKAVRKTKAVRR